MDDAMLQAYADAYRDGGLFPDGCPVCGCDARSAEARLAGPSRWKLLSHGPRPPLEVQREMQRRFLGWDVPEPTAEERATYEARRRRFADARALARHGGL